MRAAEGEEDDGQEGEEDTLLIKGASDRPGSAVYGHNNGQPPPYPVRPPG